MAANNPAVTIYLLLDRIFKIAMCYGSDHLLKSWERLDFSEQSARDAEVLRAIQAKYPEQVQQNGNMVYDPMRGTIKFSGRAGKERSRGEAEAPRIPAGTK